MMSASDIVDRLQATGSVEAVALECGTSRRSINRKLRRAGYEKPSAYTLPGVTLVASKKRSKHASPRILTLDIETSLMQFWGWRPGKQHVGIHQVKSNSRMLCFASKFYGEKKVTFFSEHHHGREAMFAGLYRQLLEADSIVTYNGKRFDMPRIKAELFYSGFDPLPKIQQLDLFQVVRREANDGMSMKLDHVCKRLGIAGKVSHTGMQLWKDCEAGDAKAWALMRKYNKHDVVMTELLYDRLRGRVGNAGPNHALFRDAEVPTCMSCGSTDLEERGEAKTGTQVYPRYKCHGCGAWQRGRSAKRKAAIGVCGAA